MNEVKSRLSEYASNMRMYSEMRFKHLTLLITVITLAGAGVARFPTGHFGSTVSVPLVAACFGMLFISVMWIMEIRAVLYWEANREAAPMLWPKPPIQRLRLVNSTNAVLALHLFLYIGWLTLAWTEAGALLRGRIVCGIAAALLVFMIVYTLRSGITFVYWRPRRRGRKHVTPAESTSPQIEQWERSGPAIVEKLEYGKEIRRQRYVNPKTKEVSTYVLFGQADWSVVVPLTDDMTVLAVEQFKQGCDQVVIELPSGTFDGDDETSETTARRELLEETGYSPKELIPLGPPLFMSTRSSWTRIHPFLATGCQVSRKPDGSPEEILKQRYISLENWLQMCTNELVEPSAIVATFRAIRYLGISAI